jgi:hypothetical protein
MHKLILATVLGTAGIGLAGCEVNVGDNAAENEAALTGEEVTTTTGTAPGTATTTTNVFVPGTRIVEEDDVFFRIDPDGTRVRLGPGDSRILVEDDVRFRVDPDGTRVRIDETGTEIRTDVSVDDDLAVEVNRP